MSRQVYNTGRQVLLDHSIVGQQDLSLTIRKDRDFAACRICGAVYQSWLNTTPSDEEYAADPLIAVAAEIENKEWRKKHNRLHSEKEHRLFRQSGLMFTPEAAHRLAPFGLVPLNDTTPINPYQDETTDALASSPRAPTDDVETTLKGWK